MLNHNQRPCQPIKKEEIKLSAICTPQFNFSDIQNKERDIWR